jgi:hypothetical protein
LEKKLIKLGLLGTLTFLCLFFYFYKRTGKFRDSILSTFAIITIYSSSLKPAYSASEVNRFTPTPLSQQHQPRIPKQEIFSKKSPNNEWFRTGKTE